MTIKPEDWKPPAPNNPSPTGPPPNPPTPAVKKPTSKIKEVTDEEVKGYVDEQKGHPQR
jgi:hypothetical protein